MWGGMTSRFDRLFGIQDGALLSVIDVTSTQIRRSLIIVFWDASLHVYLVCSDAEGNLFGGGSRNLTCRNEGEVIYFQAHVWCILDADFF